MGLPRSCGSLLCTLIPGRHLAMNHCLLRHSPALPMGESEIDNCGYGDVHPIATRMQHVQYRAYRHQSQEAISERRTCVRFGVMCDSVAFPTNNYAGCPAQRPISTARPNNARAAAMQKCRSAAPFVSRWYGRRSHPKSACQLQRSLYRWAADFDKSASVTDLGARGTILTF